VAAVVAPVALLPFDADDGEVERRSLLHLVLNCRCQCGQLVFQWYQRVHHGFDLLEASYDVGHSDLVVDRP
jgi:hypothetical protein